LKASLFFASLIWRPVARIPLKCKTRCLCNCLAFTSHPLHCWI
jgi:hypothetical protein